MKFDIDMILKSTYSTCRLRIFLVLTCFLFTDLLSSIHNTINAAEPLKSTTDIKLRSLITGLKPDAYLTDGKCAMYGNSAPLVLYVDANDISSLYSKRKEFSSVELIQIRLQSTDDERMEIDCSRLEAFTSLEYIFFVYEYPVCDDNENEECLNVKVSEAVINNTVETEEYIQVFYQLCIPQ